MVLVSDVLSQIREGKVHCAGEVVADKSSQTLDVVLVSKYKHVDHCFNYIFARQTIVVYVASIIHELDHCADHIRLIVFTQINDTAGGDLDLVSRAEPILRG